MGTIRLDGSRAVGRTWSAGTNRREHPSGCAAVALLVGLTLWAGWGPHAAAGPIDATAGTEAVGVAKAGAGIVEAKNSGAPGLVRTTFNFHPKDDVDTAFTKNPKTGVVNPTGAFTHTYSKTETHGTTGSAVHSIAFAAIPDPINPGKTIPGVRDTVTTSISPGVAGEKVSIDSQMKDPFIYSDTYAGAHFGFVPQGIDYRLSITQDTSFPQQFGSPGTAGAAPEGCFMVFRGRVAPGAVTSVESFWDAAPAGAIDLYTLTLGIDAGHLVHADLQLGASNPFFALNFQNGAGQAFDPTDPTAVAAVEAGIASSFINGTLASTLSNVLTAGFVPAAGSSEFTLGNSSQLHCEAYEPPVPAPGPVTLLAAAGLASLRRRRRD